LRRSRNGERATDRDDALALLLDAGGDAKAADGDGGTPIDVAQGLVRRPDEMSNDTNRLGHGLDPRYP
jgi:hypothetical protein